MLSLFPTLLSWQEVSPLLIRVVLGAIFLFWAYKAFREFTAISNSKRAVGVVELIIGILLVIGLWTQGAAVAVIIYLIIRLIERAYNKALLTDGVNYYLILLVLAISLLLSGAGIWAIDYAGL